MTTLINFTGANGYDAICGLVQGSDGSFYGATSFGGSSFGAGPNNVGYGTAFKVTSTGALTTLVNFTGANGYAPSTNFVQGSDGNYYGTTLYGGSTSGPGHRTTATGPCSKCRLRAL